MLGHCYALTGRVPEAIATLQRALTIAGPIPLAAAEVALVEAYLRDGSVERADTQARRALRVAEDTAEAGFAAWAHKALADVAVARGDLDDAERRLAAAIDAATTLGMRPLEARCRLDLAALTRPRGA
jgi:tetratricopeptide (TPR) repeat protein